MVMVIYHYVEIIWKILVTPDFFITYMIMRKYYPGKSVNMHIQSLINIIQKNNRVIATKNVKGKLSLFCGNRERVITIYMTIYRCLSTPIPSPDPSRQGNRCNATKVGGYSGVFFVCCSSSVSLYDVFLTETEQVQGIYM